MEIQFLPWGMMPLQLSRRAFARLAPVCGIVLTLAGCASLPAVRTVKPSVALADTAETRLGRAAGHAMSDLHGPSGIHMMPRGPDAFLARLALMANAERSLDIQYYIWHNDTTGRLLLVAMLRAAERGVRVRLLIDDVGSLAKDKTLLMLDGHPNIEVRVFNPAANRSARQVMGILRFLAHQPAHAQQVDHGRQPGGNRRRSQHRRRILRDRNGTELRRRRLARRRRGGRQGVRLFRPLLEQPDGVWIKELDKEEPTLPSEPVPWRRSGVRARATRSGVRAGHAGEPAGREFRAGAVVFSAARITVKADDPAKVEHPGQDPSKNLMPQLAPQFAAAQEQRVPGVALLRAGEARPRVSPAAPRARGPGAVLTNGLASTDILPVLREYAKYRGRCSRQASRFTK